MLSHPFRKFFTCFFVILPALMILHIAGIAAFAQADQGAITGTVTDPAGKVIEGAQVTLSNPDTNLTLIVKTNGSGSYSFSPVKIGNYTLTMHSEGFNQEDRTGIHLNIQQRLAINFSLKPGSVTDHVEVTSADLLMQTEDASIGQVVDVKTIDETPLNGRNWVFIAQLTAGVDASNGSRAQGTGDFDANGQRPEQNNFTLDGVDNNVNAVDFIGGASFVVRPPPDALAEFKIQTGTYDAEFGHSAGAVVNAALKSGTNRVHGDVWEYLRNDVLDARDFTATSVPEYRQNQFGGTLGLPILKNKLFFFADTEANRIVFANPITGVSVPSLLERQGNFSELLNPAQTGSSQPIQLYAPGSASIATPQSCNGVNNVLCPSQINPIAQKILNLYPLPNVGGSRLYSNYTSLSKVTSNTFQFDTRLDWNISPRDQAYSRFSYTNQLQFYPSPLGQFLDGGGYGSSGNIRAKGQSFMVSETHIFTPSLINEFRYAYVDGHFGFIQPGANVDASSQVGLGGIPFSPLNGGLPYTSISGISTFGASGYYPANELQNTFQILDNITKVQGNHTLKAGLNLLHSRFYTLSPPASRGQYNYTGQYTGVPGVSYTGSGVADFLTNQQQSASLSNFSGVDDAQWNSAGYIEDSWKASKHLTVDLGVRYEFWQPYHERQDRQAALQFDASNLIPGKTPGILAFPSSQRNQQLPAAFLALLSASNVSVAYQNNRQLVNGQSTNFAPRVGVAYQLNEKTVVRSGYGLFFGGTQGSGGANLGFNFPFQFTSNFYSAGCTAGNCPNDGITLENGFSQQIAAGLLSTPSYPTFNTYPANVRTTYSQQFNLSLQYAIRKSLVGTVSYVGTNARHLYQDQYVNSPLALVAPGVNTIPYEPFPLFGAIPLINPNGTSNYNSLQSKLEQRYNSGLNFLVTYTYSHSLDDAAPVLGSSGNAYTRNSALLGNLGEYTNSPWDTRHRLTLNGNYALPFGKGKTYLNKSGLLDEVVGGWSASIVWRVQTGQPFTVYNNNASANGASAHAIRVRDPFKGGGSPDPTNPGISCPAKVRTLANWYNPCAFANPPNGNTIAPGQVITDPHQALKYLGDPRENAYGPGYNRTDASLFKNFATFQEQFLQFRVDVFNLFNTPAYGIPNGSIGQNGGQITSARSFQPNTPDARFFQIAAKYVF